MPPTCPTGKRLDGCGVCVPNSAGIYKWYIDADGDGWGNAAGATKNCNNPGPGWAGVPGDYNDDCYDWYNDEFQCLTAYYQDADGDGLGGGEPQWSATPVPNRVTQDEDINDNCYDLTGNSEDCILDAFTSAGEPLPQDTIIAGSKQPRKIKGSAAARKRGINATAIFDGAFTRQDFKDVLNHVADSTESSISITEDFRGDFDVINKNLNQGTMSSTVPTSDPSHTVVAGGHTHPPKANDGPSPGDLYHLIEGNALNPKYTIDFTFHNNGTYALVVEDRSKFLDFLTKNPKSASVVTTTKGSQWSGSKTDKSSLYARYLALAAILEKAGYERAMLEEYAMVYMLELEKTGVKLLKQIDGNFKEYTTSYKQELTGTMVLNINICK